MGAHAGPGVTSVEVKSVKAGQDGWAIFGYKLLAWAVAWAGKEGHGAAGAFLCRWGLFRVSGGHSRLGFGPDMMPRSAYSHQPNDSLELSSQFNVVLHPFHTTTTSMPTSMPTIKSHVHHVHHVHLVFQAHHSPLFARCARPLDPRCRTALRPNKQTQAKALGNGC